jgi:hypothetical protein
VNNPKNATKRLLINKIFVHRCVNNAGQHEQSHDGTPGLFA